MAQSTTHSIYTEDLVLQGNEENVKNYEVQSLVSVNLGFKKEKKTFSSSGTSRRPQAPCQGRLPPGCLGTRQAVLPASSWAGAEVQQSPGEDSAKVGESCGNQRWTVWTKCQQLLTLTGRGPRAIQGFISTVEVVNESSKKCQKPCRRSTAVSGMVMSSKGHYRE